MGAAGFELQLTIPARCAARAVVNSVRGSVAALPAPLTRDISGPARYAARASDDIEAGQRNHVG